MNYIILNTKIFQSLHYAQPFPVWCESNGQVSNFCCYREAFVTPTYDIDLVWHSHQLCPASYKSDMLSILGCMLNHDDTDQDRQPGSKLNTVSSQSNVWWLVEVYCWFTDGFWPKCFGNFYKCRLKILFHQGRLNPLKVRLKWTSEGGHQRSTPFKQKFWVFQNYLFGWSLHLWCYLHWNVSRALGYFWQVSSLDQNNQDISFFAYFFVLQAHVQTAELYVRTYSEVYNRAGCMYRGLPPRHYTVYESERQKITLSTANFTVIFNKVQVRHSQTSLLEIIGNTCWKFVNRPCCPL